MMSFVPGRWSRFFVVLALLGLLAWSSAHWFWKFWTPTPLGAAPAPKAGVPTPLHVIRQSGIFGTLNNSAQPIAAPATLDLILRGISATRKGGMAVITVDKGKTVAVSAGDEIVPGTRLERVLPDHVVVSRGGVTQRLDLPRRQATDAPPALPAGTPARK